uniref:Uncharacterized protein n=1 Tax=Bat hepatitis E virus TaxID=1216472 RepID=A0A2Z5WBF5_9VIRU|nr:hypothetical protein [Bat hepatitis E virus]
MGAVGTHGLLPPRPRVGAAPGARVVAMPELMVPARLLRHHYQPGQLRLALFLSPTLINVVLSCGANTTLLRLQFPCLYLALLMQSYMQHPSPLFYLFRMAPMLTSCRPRLLITLNIGWLRRRYGSVQLFLRLLVDFQ